MKFISMKTMSLLTAAALTLSLASCGTTQTTATDAQTETTVTQSETQTTQNDQQTTQTQENTATQSNTAPGGRKDFQQQGGTLGRITAIDGDTVTVEVRQMGGRMGGGRMMTPPDFNADSGDTQQTPPDLPADSGDTQQTPPDMTQDDSAQTITLTLSQITKDGAAVTADDVSVDTFLMITMDEDGSPVSATIAEGFGGRMGGQMDGEQNGSRMNGGGMKGQPNDQTADGNSAPAAPADNTAQNTDSTNA